MASILRSSKFIRYLASFSRSLVVNHPREVDGSLIQRSQAVAACIQQKGFASVATPATDSFSNVDRSIRRLDQDVRRTGRVSSKELQEIIDEIRNSRFATSTQSLMVIRCCGNLIPEEPPEVRTKLVQEVWRTFENLGVSLDVSHYNALLRVFIENDHTFSPSEFLQDLEKKGVEANRVTFQRLVASYCQKGDIEGATRILEFMKEKQMPVNESVFNSLIIGHSQLKDMESAEGMLKVMKQANIEPSPETYTLLMCGYAKIGDMDSIDRILNDCQRTGMYLYDKDLLEVIYALAISGHQDLIDQVAGKLQKSVGFNQDAKNIVLRLVARGEEKVAVKVMRLMTPITVADYDPLPTGTFLIRQMVRSDRPFESILRICEELQSTEENQKAIQSATEASLMFQKPELSLQLLKALSRTDQVCHHYYWPVLLQFGKMKKTGAIMGTLRQMADDMGIPPSGETLRDYVVQFLSPGEAGVMQLREGGISPASAASSMAYYSLLNKNIDKAAELVLKFKANYNSVQLRRALVSAFVASKDTESLVTIVQAMEEEKQIEEDEEHHFEGSAGQVLMGITNAVRTNRAQILVPILQKFLDAGLRVSNGTAEFVQSKIEGDELTQEISTLLSKLTSPDLAQRPLERPNLVRTSTLRGKDEEGLLRAINLAKQRGDSSKQLQRQLLSHYCFEKNLEKAEAYRKELTDEGFELGPGQLYQIIDLYVHHEKLPEALATLQEALAKDPETSLDELKAIRLAHLLVLNDRKAEALELLSKRTFEKAPESGFPYQSACWRLLNALAEKKDVEGVNEMFGILRDNKYIEPSNVLLGPLIKVHVLLEDTKGALEKFEECCNRYRATPWKNEIACKLIQSEDAVSLQKITDLSTQIHGEVNSLYDLVLSFVECGRVRQARKILETPGLRARSQRLSTACERYQNEGQMEYLESMVQVTKDIQHIDRADIYYHLLCVYSKSDDVEKGLGLWTQMQDEDVQPTDQFLVTLGELLKKHDRPIPFAVPEVVAPVKAAPAVKKESTPSPLQSNLKALRRAIGAKDLDKALEIREKLGDKQLPMGERSGLLSFLINSGRHGVASKILVEWLQNDLRVTIKSLNSAVINFSNAGDVDTMNAIQSLLNEEVKKLVSFNNRYAQCMVASGKGKELLSSLRAELDAAKTPEEISSVTDTFPRGGILSLFAKCPDLIPEFEGLVEMYREKGIVEPTNVLWVHYTLSEDHAKADKLWPLLKTQPRLMFQPLLKFARSQRNEAMIKRLVETVKDSSISSVALGAIHSCMVDVQMFKGDLDAAEKALQDAMKVLNPEEISIGTMHRMKRAFEESQREFKYEIPKRRRPEHSSSSSSDSESDAEDRSKLNLGNKVH